MNLQDLNNYEPLPRLNTPEFYQKCVQLFRISDTVYPTAASLADLSNLGRTNLNLCLKHWQKLRRELAELIQVYYECRNTYNAHLRDMTNYTAIHGAITESIPIGQPTTFAICRSCTYAHDLNVGWCGFYGPEILGNLYNHTACPSRLNPEHYREKADALITRFEHALKFTDQIIETLKTALASAPKDVPLVAIWRERDQYIDTELVAGIYFGTIDARPGADNGGNYPMVPIQCHASRCEHNNRNIHCFLDFAAPDELYLSCHVNLPLFMRMEEYRYFCLHPQMLASWLGNNTYASQIIAVFHRTALL